MRAWVIASVLLLAGCTEPPADPLDGVDPTEPLFQSGGVHLLGEPVDVAPDATVLSADCRRGGVYAYTFNATHADGSVPGAIDLVSPLAPPNTTVSFLAAFQEGPDGLELALLRKGGQDTAGLAAASFYTGEWHGTLPDSLSVPLDNGIGRVAIGCHGDGAVNYIVGSATPPERPGYLDPAIVPDFDLFGAAGGRGSTIYIPPNSPPGSGPVWYTVGSIDGEHDENAPGGVRIGTTRIAWSGGPGWTTTTCGHYGWEEHGEWRYEGTLHAEPRTTGAPMADSIATLGLSQLLLFGQIQVSHAEEGDEAGEFEFTVEHVGSLDEFYDTYCYGLHIGPGLEALFGTPGAVVWQPPEAFL